MRGRTSGTELSFEGLKTGLAHGGIKVFKNGRTSGPTCSLARSVAPSFRVGYKCRDGWQRHFVAGQALTVDGSTSPMCSFARFGDEGAMAIDEKGRAVRGYHSHRRHLRAVRNVYHCVGGHQAGYDEGSGPGRTARHEHRGSLSTGRAHIPIAMAESLIFRP